MPPGAEPDSREILFVGNLDLKVTALAPARLTPDQLATGGVKKVVILFIIYSPQIILNFYLKMP